MAVVTAHPRAMHSNLATMETDLSLGPAPAVADAASTTIIRRAGELLRVLAKHLFDGSDLEPTPPFCECANANL